MKIKVNQTGIKTVDSHGLKNYVKFSRNQLINIKISAIVNSFLQIPSNSGQLVGHVVGHRPQEQETQGLIFASPVKTY